MWAAVTSTKKYAASGSATAERSDSDPRYKVPNIGQNILSHLTNVHLTYLNLTQVNIT